MIKNKYKSIVLSGFVVAFAFMPEVAFAADLSSWTEHMGKQITSAKTFALAVAFMIGLFLFIMGLHGLYKDSKQPGQDHAKKGMISLAIGTLLLIVPTIIAIAGGTFDASGDENSSKTFKANAW
jgi:TM2 domain-containing membrane protein YozV